MTTDPFLSSDFIKQYLSQSTHLFGYSELCEKIRSCEKDKQYPCLAYEDKRGLAQKIADLCLWRSIPPHPNSSLIEDLEVLKQKRIEFYNNSCYGKLAKLLVILFNGLSWKGFTTDVTIIENFIKKLSVSEEAGQLEVYKKFFKENFKQSFNLKAETADFMITCLVKNKWIKQVTDLCLADKNKISGFKKEFHNILKICERLGENPELAILFLGIVGFDNIKTFEFKDQKIHIQLINPLVKKQFPDGAFTCDKEITLVIEKEELNIEKKKEINKSGKETLRSPLIINKNILLMGETKSSLVGIKKLDKNQDSKIQFQVETIVPKSIVNKFNPVKPFSELMKKSQGLKP